MNFMYLLMNLYNEKLMSEKCCYIVEVYVLSIVLII